MKSAIEELNELKEIFLLEKEEDRIQYKELLEKSSIQERRTLGLAWYPIVIKDSYYGFGERLIVEVERPSHIDIAHQFSAGRAVSLFSNSSGYVDETTQIAGVVSAVRGNLLKITFFADELPEWINLGKIGVSLLFDDASYKEMEYALSNVIKSKNNRVAELREILLGHKTAGFNEQYKVKLPALNDSQNKGLNKVLAAEDVAILHGPPGTGKTTTLVETIIQILKEEKQVLVCAPSNTAVDILTQRLHLKGAKVLRIGNPARVNEEMLSLTVDAKVTEHNDFKQIKKLRKSASEYRNLASKYKRSFGREEKNQRKLLFDEAKKLQSEAAALEEYIIKDLISKAQVIACTLVGSANYLLKDLLFHTVIIDEAGQALEPAAWIPILKANRVVLAGDHQQLPPTVKSLEAARKGLSLTLFEKVIERQKADVLLNVQYRMNEKIMQFSNEHFYSGRLIADESVKYHVLFDTIEDAVINMPVEFIDTAGSGYGEKVNPESSSTYNPEEASLLFRHLAALCSRIDLTSANSSILDIAIISPYKAQVNLLKEKLLDFEFKDKLKVTINTIDGFQGQEKDIVYMSLVRSNEKGEIGFLQDTRRMNVALTRARKKLVVLGDSATLAGHKFYKDYLDYIERIDAYKSAWDYME
ncbi:MAG TPA: AAA domain-containing protein [Cytophagaceae bacterium]|jgi:superfamily I DNA and/or RNA helicase